MAVGAGLEPALCPLTADRVTLDATPQFGADGRHRTRNILITNEALYQLSYASKLISFVDRNRLD